MKLSIITVNYNNIEGLKKTLESVLTQNWKNFEFIIIDGGSSDGSKEIIESNKEKLDYWVSEPDNGIYHAMNKGIKVANGEYLYFLNSGDHFDNSNALEKINTHLTEKDVVYFDIKVVEKNGVRIKKCPKQLSFQFLHQDLPAHQATFIKKSLFESLGYYDENLKIVSDWKFLLLAICKHQASYKYIEDVFSTYYADGLSSKEESQSLIKFEREQVLNAEFSAFFVDVKERYKLERNLRNLRKSKTIKLLVKLGLIHEF